MSGTTTKRMLKVYEQNGKTPSLFLSGMFQSPPENFHNSESVEIDIERSDEDVAIVIQDISTGYRMNSEDLFVNKGFIPAIYKEAISLNAFSLLKRTPGDDPFKDVKFRASLLTKMFKGMKKVERKIRRSLELQASQVLQTGKLTLNNENGVAVYSLDFVPKTSHFPTASIAWGQSGATILDDLDALGEQIRDDGLDDPDEIILGKDAFRAFMADEAVQKVFDQRRADQGTISPMKKNGKGGLYRGTVEIGNYKYDIWTYGGRYKDPETGAKIQFVDPANVIMRISTGRLDASFGAIPNIAAILGVGAARLLPELPSRMSNTESGMDMFTNVWLSNDGEQMFGGVGARPLMIPTAIDTFGCLKTGVND